jgi:hypothetical protein
MRCRRLRLATTVTKSSEVLYGSPIQPQVLPEENGIAITHHSHVRSLEQGCGHLILHDP